jgi:nucleotide-binding universal stress UspA family protein
MALKDLLVVVGDDPTCATRLELAAGLARTHDARLTGLYVMIRPPMPSYSEMQFSREMRQMQDERLRTAAAEAEALFRARAGQVAGSDEWRAVEGDLFETAVLHLRHADLAVVGQGIDLGDAPPQFASLPEELALGAGRPVLVVPRYGTFPTVGELVLVAWNGSREATRAVHDALPILERAKHVRILSVNPEGGPPERMPGTDMAQHLTRHAVTAEAAVTRATDIDVGDVLLSYAADIGADLIVMGAYGHSRLREMIVGGATRQLLQQMTVPVLMSH